MSNRAPDSAGRRRFGVHVRAVMADTRWTLLPLGARAAWLQLTDLADVMPELRAPSRSATDVATLARLLSAEADEMADAIRHLVARDILEPVSGGFRLKAF